MITRRFAALALAASLFHLNIVRADVACGKHDQTGGGQGAPDHAMERVVTHASATHGAAAHASVHEAVASEFAADEPPCETPIQQECCQALASCSPVLSRVAESTGEASIAVREVAIGALTELPLSRVTTPDTPPPKA